MRASEEIDVAQTGQLSIGSDVDAVGIKAPDIVDFIIGF